VNILVTGGSGFIGTRLIDDLLKAGHKVTIFDKVKSEKYPELTLLGDVRDTEALSEAAKGKDIIYNLAAEHRDDVRPVSLYDEVNVGGAKNVVEAAKSNGIHKIIFTSSVAIYGLNVGEPDESFPAKPFNDYGRSKWEAEEVFRAWVKEDPANSLVIVRPSVIFGEGNRGNVYNLMKQIASGKFLMIGKGENKKSMGYVGNIAAFLSSLATPEPINEVYNFTDKPDLTSMEIVNIIKNALGQTDKLITLPYSVGLLGGYLFDFLAKITGKTFPVSSIRIKKFTANTTINNDKLLASGFKPPFTLKEGLERMIEADFK